MLELKTSWKTIKVCGGCKSTNIKGHEVNYCGKCGKMGAQLVLRRFILSLFSIKKEYKKYDNYKNPFSE